VDIYMNHFLKNLSHNGHFDCILNSLKYFGEVQEQTLAKNISSTTCCTTAKLKV